MTERLCETDDNVLLEWFNPELNPPLVMPDVSGISTVELRHRYSRRLQNPPSVHIDDNEALELLAVIQAGQGTIDTRAEAAQGLLVQGFTPLIHRLSGRLETKDGITAGVIRTLPKLAGAVRLHTKDASYRFSSSIVTLVAIERIRACAVDSSGKNVLKLFRYDELEQLLGLLNPQCRYVLHRRFIEDASQADVAAEIGVHENRIGAIQRYGLKQLRDPDYLSESLLWREKLPADEPLVLARPVARILHRPMPASLLNNMHYGLQVSIDDDTNAQAMNINGRRLTFEAQHYFLFNSLMLLQGSGIGIGPADWRAMGYGSYKLCEGAAEIGFAEQAVLGLAGRMRAAVGMPVITPEVDDYGDEKWQIAVPLVIEDAGIESVASINRQQLERHLLERYFRDSGRVYRLKPCIWGRLPTAVSAMLMA